MASNKLGKTEDEPREDLPPCCAGTAAAEEKDRGRGLGALFAQRVREGATYPPVDSPARSANQSNDSSATALSLEKSHAETREAGAAAAASAFVPAQAAPPSVASKNLALSPLPPTPKRSRADDDGENLGPSPSRSGAWGSSSKGVRSPLRRLAGTSSNNSNSPPAISRNAKAERDASGNADAIYVFRLCLASEIDPSTGGIRAKDPSNTSYSAVEHINDGSLETRWISLSRNPGACMFYASEAVHKRGLELSDLVLVEVVLNRNDPNVFDLSEIDAVSRSHRDELGVTDNARAAGSTRLLQELVVEGDIEAKAIVQLLPIPDLDSLPRSFDFHDFTAQFDFSYEEFEEARRPRSPGPPILAPPKVDHAANKRFLQGLLAQPEENLPKLPLVQTSQRTLDLYFGNGNSAAASPSVVKGTGKARVAGLLSARREVKSLHKRGSLPTGNFLLQQGVVQYLVASEADARFFLQLKKEIVLMCEANRDCNLKAGFCTASQLGKRVADSFTYPARYFDRTGAAHLAVLALNKVVAEKGEGALIHMLDDVGRRVNIRFEWEGTTSSKWKVSIASPGFFYIIPVRPQYCTVPDFKQVSLYFDVIKEHQDGMRNAPPDAPRIADGSRRAPRNSFTGEYHSNVNLGEGRRPADGQVADLEYVEALKAGLSEEVLFDAFELESEHRVHEAIKESELALSLISTDRYQRIIVRMSLSDFSVWT